VGTAFASKPFGRAVVPDVSLPSLNQPFWRLIADVSSAALRHCGYRTFDNLAPLA
jgi:hypothetical protein